MQLEQTIQSFMQAWSRQEWKSALNYTQITWKHALSHPNRSAWQQAKDAFNRIDYAGFPIEAIKRKLSAYEIDRIYDVDIDLTGSLMEAATVTVTLSTGKVVLVTMRILKESGPFEGDDNGTWGVNPTSIKVNI